MWNDTRHPSARHGWLLHGLQTPDQATIAHAELACDDEFRRFLRARLSEEIRAAVRRTHRSRQGYDGLRLLNELVRSLDDGLLPDDVTLDLVVSAYAVHPDFQPGWRTPNDLVPAPPSRGVRPDRAARSVGFDLEL